VCFKARLFEPSLPSIPFTTLAEYSRPDGVTKPLVSEGRGDLAKGAAVIEGMGGAGRLGRTLAPCGDKLTELSNDGKMVRNRKARVWRRLKAING
jgi:hypothetical protein